MQGGTSVSTATAPGRTFRKTWSITFSTTTRTPSRCGKKVEMPCVCVLGWRRRHDRRSFSGVGLGVEWNGDEGRRIRVCEPRPASTGVH